MRIRIISMVVMVLALLPAVCGARESADTISVRRAFVELPSDAIDLLTQDMRLDMLDYFDADSTYQAINTLRGLSELKTVKPDFIEVQLTPVSTLQIKVLKLKNGSDIVMTVYTIGEEGDTQDSEIRVYDSGLKELSVDKFIKVPKFSDFFDTKGYQTSMKEIEQMVPYYTVVYTLSPDNTDMMARLALGDIVTVEDASIVNLLMKPSLTFLWNGKGFR